MVISSSRIADNIKKWFHMQIDSLGSNTPMVKFMKPMITRAVDKKLSNVDSMLDIISDSEGNIDINTLMDEMISNLKTTEAFDVDVPYLGKVYIGNGGIKIPIPVIDKNVLLNIEDLELLKETLVE